MSSEPSIISDLEEGGRYTTAPTPYGAQTPKTNVGQATCPFLLMQEAMKAQAGGAKPDTNTVLQNLINEQERPPQIMVPSGHPPLPRSMRTPNGFSQARREAWRVSNGLSRGRPRANIVKPFAAPLGLSGSMNSNYQQDEEEDGTVSPGIPHRQIVPVMWHGSSLNSADFQDLRGAPAEPSDDGGDGRDDPYVSNGEELEGETPAFRGSPFAGRLRSSGGSAGGEGMPGVDGTLGAQSTDTLMKIPEYVASLKESLSKAVKLSTKEETVGSVMFDNLIRILPEPEMLTKLGRSVMARAFRDILATASSFAADPVMLTEIMHWVGLRHVHYAFSPQYLPLFKQGLMAALEQMLGDNWGESYEAAWSWAWETASEALVGSYETMCIRVELINADWAMAIQQLGAEALAAKVSANLLVTSMTAAKGKGKGPKGGGAAAGGARNTALATDVVALLEYLVESINDLPKLRGVIDRLGIPFEKLFKNFKLVPNLSKIQGVVLQTMEEVVGAQWDEDHMMAWEWLWSLATVERSVNAWRSTDRDILLQSWLAVEKVILQEIADNAPEGAGRDFFAEEVQPGAVKKAGFAVDDDELGEGGGSERQSGKSMKSTKKKGGGNIWQRFFGNNGGGADDDNKSAISGASKQRKSKQTEQLKARLSEAPKVTWEVAEIFARKIFKMFATDAPTVDSIFVKHRDAYTHTVQGILNRLLAYINDPHLLWIEDEELALRHIKYGVMPGDIPIFREIFLATFQDIAAGSWTKRYNDTWKKYLSITLSGLSEVLVSALDPVAKALIIHSPSDLMQGLKEAPRGRRAEMACQIVIKGESKPVIYWMIEAGHTKLVKILMRDVLAIRANRSGVWWGGSTLWEWYGKDLVKTICQMAPEASSDLLDGHIWCSDVVVRGKRRVIFYVRDLWGDSTRLTSSGEPMYKSVAESPLALLVRMHDVNVASHPLVQFLVEKKWTLFVRKQFLMQELMGLFQILALCLGYVWLADSQPGAAFVCRAIVWTIAVIWFGIFISRCHKQIQIKMYRPKLAGFDVKCEVPVTAASSWNVLRTFAALFMIVIAVEELVLNGAAGITSGKSIISQEPDATAILNAFGVLILFMSSLQLMMADPRLSELLLGTQVLLNVVAKYTVILGLFVIAFSVLITLIASDTAAFATFEVALANMSALALGAYEVDLLEAQSATSVRIVLVLYSLATALLLINGLVAVMIAVYQQERGDMEKKAMLGLAEIVTEFESVNSTEFLKKISDSLNFSRRLSLDDVKEIGPDGGIEALVDASTFTVPGYTERGRASRVERYDSEEGPEAPWPDESAGAGGAVEGGGQSVYTEKAMTSLRELEREVKNMRAPANRLFRYVKKSAKNRPLEEIDENRSHATRSSQGVVL